MKQIFITAPDKKRIAVYESNGKGQAVLFIHGNSLSAELFAKQLNSGLGKTHRLIAFDLPGHGNSDIPLNPQDVYTTKGFIDCILYVLDQLQLKEIILVGHSLGGHLIIEAAEYLPHAKGYVIFGTPPLGVPPALDKAYLPNAALSLAFKADLSDEEINILTASFVAKDYSDGAVMKQVIKKADKNFRSLFPASAFSGGMKDEVKIVAALNKPLAIFHGEKDQLVNLDYIKSLSIPILWKKEIQIIKNAGHCPQWENAEAFNNLLESFVESLVKS